MLCRALFYLKNDALSDLKASQGGSFWGTLLGVPKDPKKPRGFKVGDEIRVNLHHGKIEDAVVRAVIQDGNEIKLQVDVVGIDLTALIDTRQVVE